MAIFITNGIKLIEYLLYYLGYPLHALKKHMLKAAKLTQDELLTVKQKPKTSTLVMVTKFNPSNPDIKQFIHSNWNIIEHSNDCVSTFKDKPLVGFRKLP